MIYSELIADTANITDEELQAYSVTERLEAVQFFFAEIRNRVSRKEADSSPHTAVDIDSEIEAMRRISSTIRHSLLFLEFLANSRSLTLSYIECDHRLLDNIRVFGDLNHVEQWDVINDVGIHQGLAFRECLPSGIHASLIRTDFFQESREDGWMTGGYKRSEEKDIVHVNVHEDAISKQGWKGRYPLSVRIHEGIHDIGAQLAARFTEHSNLQDFAYDAQLYAELEKARATIGISGFAPVYKGKIYPAYRTQFHEVVAFDEQDEFALGLDRLVEGQALEI